MLGVLNNGTEKKEHTHTNENGVDTKVGVVGGVVVALGSVWPEHWR